MVTLTETGHLHIPEGTTRIDWDAAWGIDKAAVKTVGFPTSLTTIGSHAFMYTSLAHLSIPDTITTIESHAFAMCTSLKSVSIPKTVQAIGSCTFRGCKTLTKVSMQNGLTGIGEYAFFGCSLSSLKIPKSVWMIGDSAFSACSRLTSVTIPDNVWIIGNHAFCACTSLVTIVLHTQLVCVGVGAFGCCTSLKVMLVRRAFNPNRNAETPYIPWESCVLVANDVVPVEPMQHVWAKLMEPLGNIEDELDHLEHPVKDTLAASSFPRETFRETMRGMLNCPGNRPGAFDSAPPEFEEMGGCTTDVGSLRIWAPNDVIEFLTGPFAAYNTLSDVPASMRAAPGQRSWKGILLWSKHYHNECTICGEHGARKCEGCFRTQYCSKQCQQTHWRNGGHKEECKLPTFSSTALFKTISMAI